MVHHNKALESESIENKFMSSKWIWRVRWALTFNQSAAYNPLNLGIGVGGEIRWNVAVVRIQYDMK